MRILLSVLILAAASPALADQSAFAPGPVYDEFGPVADVDETYAIPDGAEFKVSFDTRVAAEEGAPNKTLVSAARFFNMHARAGVTVEDIHVAVVLHGPAVRDVAKPAGENANAALIDALTAKGVKIIVCGQSAAYYEVKTADLLPGVDMALSAMTAHALLQQDGYTLNPF